MSETNKISVIIPIYNVEEYLSKCLDSVINQTYTNLEIICVNDGSPDNCQQILEEYKSKDKRIIVIEQENGGVSIARNRALEVVTGDYIAFIDPDDWIELDFYETAIKKLKEHNADIFCGGIFDEYEDRTVKRENKLPVKEVITDKNEFLLYAFKRDYYRNFGAFLWNKVFKAGLFENVKFDETLFVGEDIVVFTVVALKANKFAYTYTAYYHYLQRATSALHSVNLEKRETILTSYDLMLNLLSQYSISEEIAIWQKRFRTFHASNLAEIAIAQNDVERLGNYQNEIKKYLSDYIKTNVEHPERIKYIEEILKHKI